MNVFPDVLTLEDAGMPGGVRAFRLASRFRCFSSFGQITVPAGFLTDGSSIPRAFWNLFSPTDDSFLPGVVHDFLYSPFNDDFTRSEADLIFLELMHNVGVPWYRRNVIHAAVKVFGGKHFKARISKL